MAGVLDMMALAVYSTVVYYKQRAVRAVILSSPGGVQE
jgi:hypothetical protein